MTIKLSTHQLLATFAFAVLLMGVGMPLISSLRHSTADKIMQAMQSRNQRQATLLHAREDSALTEKMSGAPDADEIENVLAPVDRLEISTLLERQARLGRLENFTYTIKPEQKRSVETPLAGRIDLAHSVITCEGETIIDNDIYNFLDALRRHMPGRVHIVDMQLDRNATKDMRSIHFKVDMDWLSNGASNAAGARL